MATWTDTLKQHYSNGVVDKSLLLRHVDSRIPRFITESVLSEYCATDGVKAGLDRYHALLERHVPKSGTQSEWHLRLQTEGEVSVIDKFRVEVHVERDKGRQNLKIPVLNIDRGEVDQGILQSNPRLLNGGLWGLGKLKYGSEGVRLVKFHSFVVSKIRLDHFISGRAQFSEAEWVDILVSSMGFSPSSSPPLSREKLIKLCRLLPLVEEHLFLAEFGRPGTGKTFLFDQLTSNAFVISGSQATPAQLFYNLKDHRPGLLSDWNCLVFDEIDKLSDRKLSEEVVNKLLKFMESGTFDRGSVERASRSSIMFSGNLPKSFRNGGLVFGGLAKKLQHPAFLDRLAGIIPGWELPALGQQAETYSTDLGFSADYFSQVLSDLRHRSYPSMVSRLRLDPQFTTRDEKAVKKTFEGFVKLVFPDGECTSTVAQKYLDLALELRQSVIRERYALHNEQEDFRILTASIG